MGNVDSRPAVTALRADRALRVAGALAALAGAALPWIRLELFGVPVTLPGLVGPGLLGATAAALTLLLGRFPAARLALALVPLIVGIHGARTVGRDTARTLLSIQSRLAVVNARLERVALPPIEPFGGIGRRRDLTGPGPAWMAGGGALLLCGALVGLAGSRLGRQCVRCGALWGADRAASLTFCPTCGGRADGRRACEACRGPLESADQFCGSCGKAASVSKMA